MMTLGEYITKPVLIVVGLAATFIIGRAIYRFWKNLNGWNR